MIPSFLRATALAVALTMSFSLAGCNLNSVSSDVSASLPTICSLGTSAHAAFSAIAATGKLSQAAVNDEAAAYDGLQALCANPPKNLSAAIAEAGSIYATIANALSAAQATPRPVR